MRLGDRTQRRRPPSIPSSADFDILGGSNPIPNIRNSQSQSTGGLAERFDAWVKLSGAQGSATGRLRDAAAEHRRCEGRVDEDGGS